MVDNDGIYKPNVPVFGVDSWQARLLGRSLLVQMVQTEVAAGVTLHCPETR